MLGPLREGFMQHIGSVVVSIHTVPMSIYFAPQVVFLYRTDPVCDAAFRFIHSGQFLETSASVFCSLALASVSFVRLPNVPIFHWRFWFVSAKVAPCRPLFRRLIRRYPFLRSGGSIYCHSLLSMLEFNKSILSASTVRLFSASTLRCSVTVVRQNQSRRIQPAEIDFYETEELVIDLDPGNWPAVIHDSARIYLVRKGLFKIRGQKF